MKEITISVVNGGFILTTTDQQYVPSTSVFTSESKLLKQVKDLISAENKQADKSDNTAE